MNESKCIVARTNLEKTEYLLNDDGTLMEFDNKAQAETFIEAEFYAPEIVRYLDLEQHLAGKDVEIESQPTPDSQN